ncbi:MAG: choice-of-anchor D domain-containing protein, partial [Ignavibacteriales bacterium]|nr:choice-of-anchor D domain-containing protein [Ignavibacteriales bacterium]
KTITPQHQNYSNLVVYYDFDENVLPIPDKSGKNNNGSVFNFNANPSWITSTAGVGVPYFNFKEIIPFKDFGTLVVGETKLDSSIVIINTGGKSLHITSSLTDNQNYTVMPASFSVNPGEKKRVFIKYTPVVGSIGTEGFVQSVSGYFYHNSGGVASVDSFYATGKAVEITGSNNKNLQSMPYNYSAIDVRTLPSSDNYTVSFWAKDIRTVVIDYFLLSVAPMQFYGSDCLQNLPNKLIQSIYSYEWHHYTIQLSKVPNERNSLLTYIDGKNYSRILLGNSADSVSYINRIRISSYSNIDELAIWNTILSPNEIIKLSHYSNITVSPYKPNLMGYYRFEEPASLTIADSSGNGRNAITGQLPTLTLFSGAPTGEPLILKGNDVLRDHNFGKISFGDSSRLNVTMYNPGNQLLRLSSVQTTDSSFSVVGDVSKIAPNASQTIFLKFKPKVYGDFIDTLTFNHNGPNSPLSIIVTGRSTGTTTLTVPTVLNFGSMPFGTSLTQIFTIRNNGTAPAIITGIAEDYVGSPIFVCSPLSLVVQPGATDSIAVAFKPKFVEYTSTYHKIVVRTEDAGTYTIPVSGKGTYAGQLQVPTTVLMYEDAKALSANTKSVVINNPGTGTVVITGYTCSDSDVVVQGPASIPPGDSGRITVSVIPKLPGVKSGTVYITYDKANSNGGAIPMIDSSITFSATATFGPLTDADNAFYSGYTTYSGGNYYGYNMDKGFLQDSNRIRFDSAFTFETWIQPYGGGFPIFYDKGGIKITLHPAIYTLNYSGYYYGYFSSSASTYFNSFYLGVEMNSQSIEFGKRSADYTYVTYDYYGRTSNYIYSGYQGDIPKDKWLHLAVTWKEGDLLRAYLNGNLIGSASVIGSSVAYPDSNNDGFFISPYYGYMDETMLWKKAKTQEEILRSYNEGIGSTIGLAAYWKFSETSGQTFFDVSGNKNHLKNSNPSDDKSLSVLPLDSGGLMLGNISLPAYNINSTNPRTVNLPLKTLGRNRGVRVELPDTTYVKLTSQYFGVSKSEYEYSLLLYPQSVGTSNVTINFYDLLTNELLKTYEVALRGFSSKISGSIVNKTNNAECLNKPITVQLTNNNNEVLRETTTTCGYEFNNLAPGVYKVKQLGIASFYYTLGGKCYFNSGISPGIPVLRRDGFTYSVNAITIPGETNYPNNFSSIILETTFNTGLAFPATLCSGFKNHSLAGLGNGKTADTVSWTNPVEWNGELPSDTADIAVAYPGYYDQLTVKLDLTELGAYCASHSCTGDVTTLRSVYLADSATMTVVGNGAWNITNNLLVEGSMLLDLDSNATLLLGNLEVKGNLTIPEGKNPTIIINGNMTISGTFNPGNSTIILNGEKLNTITSPLAVGDSTKNTVDFYNLTLNSDSTLIADNIRIHNQLFLNGNVRSGDSLNDVGSENDNIIIVSPSPDAIVGNGKVLNGTIVRSIDQSEPGTYRFHTPTTQITLTSSQNLPTFISLSRVLNTMPVDTFYNVLKGGTVNETDNTVTANDVSLDGKWKFASSNYQQNDPTGGPVYEIISDGGATADISLTYDVAQLNGLDVSSLALIQEVSALKIFSKNDNDGDIVSDTDRTELEWSFSLYRDSVSEQSFVETYTGSNLTVENLSNGKYIIVPKDSVGWRIISKMVNNISSYDSIPVSEVTVFISPGQLNTVAFTRNRVFLIIASSTLNGTITPQDTIEVAMNRSVTYSIVPNFGYRINSVVIDGFDIGATNSFTFDDVSEPHTISATFVFDDNVLFRTFAANSDLSKKATKLAYKKGSLVAPPNIATAVEGEFKKLGKPGAVFLGVPQTVKADAKKYAWIAYKKAGDLGKLFTSPHSEKYYPLDTLRGTKSKAITGLVKAERKKYNNKAFEQAVAFKLNLYASEDSITPNNFGALVLDTALTLAGKELHGVTLSDISLYLDTVMTYWKARGIDDDTAYAELKAVIDIIQLINEGFSAPISATNHTLASESVIKKNPYAVILKGVKRASDVGFVKFIAGKQVRRTPILAEEIPTSFALYQNYPNPFNPTTTIRFDLPKSSLVSLKIYNILGQEITTLLNKQEYDEGQYEIVFDASRLATGVYFYRLSLNDNSFTEVKKLVLLK